MLSPLELENKRIMTSKRKYDRYEMDDYLDMVFENYKALYNENEELKKQIKTLTEGIQYYRSIESTMQKALVLAEKTSKETKDAAILKAEAIEKDANNKATQIIGTAEAEYTRIREKCLALVSQFNNYKAQLQNAANEQLRLISSTTFEVEAPDIAGTEAYYDDGAEPVAMTGVEPAEPAPSVVPPQTYEEQPVMMPHMEAEPVIAPAEEPVSPAPGRTVYSGTAPNMHGNMANTMQDSMPDSGVHMSSPENDFVFSDETAPSGPIPDKTMVLPDVKSVDREAIRQSARTYTSEQTQSILEAETINLNDSIQAVKNIEQAPLEVPPVDPTPVVELEPEPAQAKPQPQGLDSILQNMTIGKKKNKGNGDAQEDPFEFLGSVDDF